MKDKNNVSLRGMFSHYNYFTQSDMNDHHKEMEPRPVMDTYKFTLKMLHVKHQIEGLCHNLSRWMRLKVMQRNKKGFGP